MDNEEVGTQVVPAGYEFPEEPEIIEGEFREIPPDVPGEEKEGFFRHVGRVAREELKRRREIEELREEARARRGAPAEPSGVIKAVGGLYKAIVPQKTRLRETRELYLGRPQRKYIEPSIPIGELHRPPKKMPAREALEIPRRMPAKEALTPGLEALRKKGELKAEPTELDLSQLRGRLTITNLQMDQKPRGWSDAEWLVFREIRSNHDVDTVEHVTEEVAQFGGGKAAVKTAIRNLIKRGVVYEDKSFPGEPVLRVIPRR